jgi:hypothetical protein
VRLTPCRVCWIVSSIFALVVILSLASPASAQSYVFGEAVFPAGQQPQSIATGDLNGDGILDLVVVNQADSTLNIYLGQPNGSFTLATYPAGPDSVDSVSSHGTFKGSFPTWVILGDFNNDGVLDVVVDNSACVMLPEPATYGCAASYISVFLGNGDGTFQARQDFNVPSGALSVQAADLNGDGNLDLVVASNVAASMTNTNTSVSILLGKGDGTFQSPVTYPTPAGESTLGLGGAAWAVVADFNGDGIPDIAASNGAQGVAVFLGNGDGTLQTPRTFAIPDGAAYGPYSGAVAGDFNGDGKQDLAITTGASTLTVSPVEIGVFICLGNGDGTFTPQFTILGYGGFIAAADVDKDGKLDLIFAGSVAYGNGDGTFTQGQYLGASGWPTSGAAGDFNGDGQIDLAFTNATANPAQCPGCPTNPGSLAIFLGDGNRNFGVTTVVGSVGVANSIPSAILPVDVNGDGKVDLAFVNSGQSGSSLDNTVSVLLGNGDGTFQTQKTFATGTLPVDVRAGDFNGDGKPDLAVLNQVCALTATTCGAGSISILFGNGDGTFQSHTDYGVGVTPLSLGVADFNGDGKPDLAAANYGLFQSDTVSVLINNGDGTFASHVDYTLPGPPNALAVGDFNGDGIPDMAASTLDPNPQSSVYLPPYLNILPGKGDGTFQAPVSSTLGSVGQRGIAGALVPTGTLQSPNAALLGVHIDSLTYDVFYSKGGGMFSDFPQNFADTSAVTGFLATGDFNADGNLDFALVNRLGGITLMLGDGQGDFAATQTLVLAGGLDPTNRDIASADFNGDGVPDLAVSLASNTTPGILSVLLNDPFKAVSPTSLAFGSQGLTTTSAAHVVTITNPSPTPFTISSVAISGPFTQTNNCVAKLSRGQSCTIQVTFVPTALGASNGAITLTDTTHASPQIIPLSGTGVNGSYLQFSPSRLVFSSASEGVASPAQAVKLANTGNSALSISGIGITGGSGFTQTNNCGTRLAAGGACTVSVTFTPTAGGSASASLNFTDGAPASPQKVALVGAATAPQLSLNPASLSFGTVQVNTSSVQSVTLSNTGTAALNITGISATGDFAQTNNCGASLAATSSTCQITVTFTPATTGNLTGTLAITDNATGSPQTVPLNGTGSAAPPPPAPVVSLSPLTLTFSAQYVSTSGLPQTVTVTNTGSATLNIANVAASSADFGLLSNCSNPVPAGANCTIGVFFDPTAGGTRTGTLNITDNAANSPQSVTLTGSGEDFSMSAAAASATITAGQTATYSLALAPAGGFASSVSLSCGGGPAQSTCAVSPSTISLSGTTAKTAMVTVTTAAAGSLLPFGSGWPTGMNRRPIPFVVAPMAMFLLIFTTLIGATLIARRQEQRFRWASALALPLLVCLGMTLSSCGGGSSGGGGGGGSQAGTYAITVTGTFTSGSTNLTHTTKLTLVVQ